MENKYYLIKGDYDCTYILRMIDGGWDWVNMDNFLYEMSAEEAESFACVDYEKAEELQKEFGGEICEWDI